MKPDWKRLEELIAEIRLIAIHHGLTPEEHLLSLENLTDIIKSIEDE